MHEKLCVCNFASSACANLSIAKPERVVPTFL